MLAVIDVEAAVDCLLGVVTATFLLSAVCQPFQHMRLIDLQLDHGVEVLATRSKEHIELL